MHTRLICAAMLLLIAPLGCRSQGELDLAERDMRLQENRIYKLQEYVQQYQQMLENCQAENDSLRKQLVDSGRTPLPGSPKPRTLRELLNSNKPATTEAAPAGPALTIPVTPSIDLGTEFDPTLTAPVETTPNLTPPKITPPTATPRIDMKPSQNSAPSPPGFAPAAPATSGELPEPDDLPAPSSGADANQSTMQLAIRAVGQVPGNANMPGGLLIVIEPRSAQGGSARAPAGATMSLMIVAGPEEDAMGRWDYSAAQVDSAFKSGFGASSAWRYVVPFNKTPSTPDQLKLYVRMVLPDGTKLIAERDFDANAGASLEEVPSGDAGWFRSRQPIASLANKLGRDARTAVRGGFQPSSRSAGSSPTSRSNNARGGNVAPAWQLQPLDSPSASASTAARGAGGTAPAYVPAPAPGWNMSEITTAPLESQATPSATAAPVAETATRPDRPAWSPYR